MSLSSRLSRVGAVTCVAVMAACANGRTVSDANGPTASDGNGAAAPAGFFPAPDQVRMLEYPVEGVDLGQGWHRESVRKAVATCVDFTPREDTGQEQSMELSVVTDSSALMDTLDISAEAQFKAIGYSVSGKAAFAKDTEVRSSSLNVLAYAKVMNGVAYVAPEEAGSQAGRIDLTPHYRDLARRDRVAFEEECGDGFVTALYSGAELTAMLSFSETSTSERTAIETAMSGSGWGFSASGAANSTMEKAAKAGRLRVTFYQTGGIGQPDSHDSGGLRQRHRTAARARGPGRVSLSRPGDELSRPAGLSERRAGGARRVSPRGRDELRPPVDAARRGD